MVKNLPAMQETQVQFLGWEDSLEMEINLPTPVFLSGIFHGQKSLVGFVGRWVHGSMELHRVGHD